MMKVKYASSVKNSIVSTIHTTTIAVEHKPEEQFMDSSAKKRIIMMT
jgi:hypothetical protein